MLRASKRTGALVRCRDALQRRQQQPQVAAECYSLSGTIITTAPFSTSMTVCAPPSPSAKVKETAAFAQKLLHCQRTEDVEIEDEPAFIPETDGGETRPPVRSLYDIITSMRARQNTFKEAVSNDDPRVVASLAFAGAGPEGAGTVPHLIDQQQYLERAREGDLIETRTGDVGVVVQVPDYVTVHKYAVVDHQGSVSFYAASGRSFAFKIPGFVTVPQKTLPSLDKTQKDTKITLASLVRVINSDDPNKPTVTIAKRLKDALCPRIKEFVARSQKMTSSVEQELEFMFNELQDSATPINVSLFEVAFAVDQNLERLSSDGENTTKGYAEKYSILKAQFPPHGLEGARRKVDTDVMHAVYTAIYSRFASKVLFDNNDRFTPNTLTLLPFSQENEQNQAIKAMRVLVARAASQEASRAISQNEKKQQSSHDWKQQTDSKVRFSPNVDTRKLQTQAQTALDAAPTFFRDLITIEYENPQLLSKVIDTSSDSTVKRRAPASASPKVTSAENINRFIINLLSRFAAGDISRNDANSRSIVVLFLKHLDHYRAFAKIAYGLVPPDTPMGRLETGEISESYALDYLQRIGVLKPQDNPLRMQSKVKSVEYGGTRVHKFVEPPKAVELPDRLEPIREQLADDLTVYCIDDASAHEIDDGISVKIVDDTKWKVYVHIADPSSALQVDGPSGSDGLLRHAYSQTSTAYYPETVIPMFPPWFTQRLGLVEDNDDKLQRCMTFAIDFDPRSGKFDTDNVQILPAATRSIKQITYDAVDKILKQAPDDADGKTEKDLRNLWRVATAFSKHRHLDGGAIAVSLSRPQIQFSSEQTGRDKSIDISIKFPQRSVARELVAEFMILCNHATALYMAQHDIPGIFRTQEIHLETEAASSQFADILKASTASHDWTVTPWSQRDTGSGIGPNLNLRDSLHLLPILRPATLGVTCKRHAALGIPAYMHATSPLRRFQDVVCHWQLGSHLLAAKTPKSRGTYAFDMSQADTMSIRLMRTQGLLRRAQQQSNMYWMLRYLEQQLQSAATVAACGAAAAGFSTGSGRVKINLSRAGDNMPAASLSATCIITSQPFFGVQLAYSTQHGVFVELSLDDQGLTSPAVQPKRVYAIGEVVECTIDHVDTVKLLVRARPAV